MWWVYLLAYAAAGAIFCGWVLMTLDDEDQSLAKHGTLLIALWPILLLMLVGAWLGRR